MIRSGLTDGEKTKIRNYLRDQGSLGVSVPEVYRRVIRNRRGTASYHVRTYLEELTKLKLVCKKTKRSNRVTYTANPSLYQENNRLYRQKIEAATLRFVD